MNKKIQQRIKKAEQFFKISVTQKKSSIIPLYWINYCHWLDVIECNSFQHIFSILFTESYVLIGSVFVVNQRKSYGREWSINYKLLTIHTVCVYLAYIVLNMRRITHWHSLSTSRLFWIRSCFRSVKHAVSSISQCKLRKRGYLE